jgi:dihydrofolate reductase
MILSLIAAMDRNRVIGRDNALPWHLPADLRHFKALTLGKPILMGRRTFESIGRPLPGRQNIVLTHDPVYVADGCDVVHSIDAAVACARGEELMVIGGATLYAQCLPRADRLYLTLVDAEVGGDAVFPAFDASQWHESSSSAHPADSHNAYACRFVTLLRGSARQA